jgi:N-acetylmuramoyl-L-alanine amidase
MMRGRRERAINKLVGISIGHYGPGTGASFEGRDEWEICMDAGTQIFNRLMNDGVVDCELIWLNKKEHPWNIIHRLFNLGDDADNMDLRAEWAIREDCDLFIELHMNSHKSTHWADGKGKEHPIQGHEILIFDKPQDHSIELARHINVGFSQFLDNRKRGIKKRKLYILRRLDRLMPTILVEPYFLFEDCLGEGKEEALGALVQGITKGIYLYYDLLKGD